MASRKHTTPTQLDFSFTEPEMWLAIVGFEGLYEVSNLGRVRSLDRHIIYSRVPLVLHRHPGRIMRQGHGKHRHCYVGLRKDGTTYDAYVHVLVLEAFVGPRPDGLVCNHRDGDPTNNTPGNLEWVTQGRNVEHAYDIGKRQRGEQHSSAKLPSEQVREIRQRAAQGETSFPLARAYGVHPRHIRLIVRRKTWKHLL